MIEAGHQPSSICVGQRTWDLPIERMLAFFINLQKLLIIGQIAQKIFKTQGKSGVQGSIVTGTQSTNLFFNSKDIQFPLTELQEVTGCQTEYILPIQQLILLVTADKHVCSIGSVTGDPIRKPT